MCALDAGQRHQSINVPVVGMVKYDSKLIEKYAAPVPRYTSYPTAPHFTDNFSAEKYQTWLEDIASGTPVSLYIHIPFCDRLCWFCGCHTKQTHKYEPVLAYLDVLYKEIDLIGSIAGERALVAQLHLGGGSPSMLKPAELAKLKSVLTKNFRFSNDVEISIELDPSDMDDEIMLGMSQFGMNRASIGVQDFAEDVQQAINRPQSFEDTKRVVDGLRAIGIHSLNIDALYGLPLQTQTGLRKTLEQVVSLNPDRIALFGYAHVPWMKKHQKLIPADSLPGLDERFSQARMAEDYLSNNGFTSIGIDHFSRTNDTLAKASANKKIRRNFQGYTTDTSQFLIGLGASSIGQTPNGFVQNTHATASYMRQVENGELPVSRGLVLSENDKMFGAVIERLMCHFELETGWLDEQFGGKVDKIYELADELVSTNEDHYFVKGPNGYLITEEGKPFTRQIVAHFDEYLHQGKARHSIAV